MSQEEVEEFLERVADLAGEHAVGFAFVAIVEGPNSDMDPDDKHFVMAARGGTSLALGMLHRGIISISAQHATDTEE